MPIPAKASIIDSALVRVTFCPVLKISITNSSGLLVEILFTFCLTPQKEWAAIAAHVFCYLD